MNDLFDGHCSSASIVRLFVWGKEATGQSQHVLIEPFSNLHWTPCVRIDSTLNSKVIYAVSRNYHPNHTRKSKFPAQFSFKKKKQDNPPTDRNPPSHRSQCTGSGSTEAWHARIERSPGQLSLFIVRLLAFKELGENFKLEYVETFSSQNQDYAILCPIIIRNDSQVWGLKRRKYKSKQRCSLRSIVHQFMLEPR